MKNYSYAAACAMIGLGISLFIAIEFEFDLSIAVILGLGLGGFIGFFIGALQQVKPTPLQEKFQNLGNLVGMSISDIENKCGAHTTSKTCNITDRDNEQGFLYVWSDGIYTITLLFDNNLKCIGVNNETRY